MEPKRGKRQVLLSLAAAAAVVFVATSGLVGFRLGRNAAAGAGALVDTIVLSPDQSLAQGRAEITHFLSGRLLHENGEPCQAATVRFLESGKADETDDLGKFYFSDVQTGENTLEIVDQEGALLGRSTLNLDFQEGAALAAEENKLTLPQDVRMLEVTLTLDPKQQSVSFDEAASCAVTVEGTVVNFTGQALSLPENSASVVPGGDVVTNEGYVLLPSKAVAITPWGGRQNLTPTAAQEDEPTESTVEEEPVSEVEPTVPGVSIDEDGGLTLENGAAILPGGVVVVPEEDPVGPTDDVVLVPPDGAAEILPDLPEIYEPSPTPEPTPTPTETPESAVPPPAANGGLAVDEPPAADEPAAEPTQEPTPEPTATPDPVSISWSQQSIVDLFKNRVSGEELGTKTVNGKEVPVIAPGSSGYYDFNLRNDADYNIRFTLSISEGSFHLPILYSVRDLETNYVYQGGSKVNTDGSAITTDYITLPPHSERSYRLGWNWQTDDWLAPWWDNEFDTAAAGRTDRTYMVSLGIYAEQSYSAKKK